jgi:3',5'-cyclic-AMP phosphodiesterase
MAEPLPDVIVQLTDLHVQVGPGDVVASERVAAAVELVSRIDAPLAGILLTGDLVNSGTAAEYARLRELLEPVGTLGVPLVPVVGNHDDRALLCSTFAELGHPVASEDGEHVQYEATLGGHTVLVLDTQRTGYDDGELCAARFEWLEAAFTRSAGRPTIVAMHHPPTNVGLAWADAIGLPADDRRRFAELVATAPHVERIVAGHVHRACITSVAHVPVFVCPSVHYPAQPDIGASTTPALVQGPVGAGVHVPLAGGGMSSLVRMIGAAPNTRVPVG